MSITLTTKAAEHVRSALAKRGQGLGLRVAVRKSGCSGFAYEVDYADAIGGEDLEFESNGVMIIVDRKSLPFVDGTELDYTRDGLNSSFKFNNPNVTAQCGCGESFAV